MWPVINFHKASIVCVLKAAYLADSLESPSSKEQGGSDLKIAPNFSFWATLQGTVLESEEVPEDKLVVHYTGLGVIALRGG